MLSRCHHLWKQPEVRFLLESRFSLCCRKVMATETFSHTLSQILERVTVSLCDFLLFEPCLCDIGTTCRPRTRLWENWLLKTFSSMGSRKHQEASPPGQPLSSPWRSFLSPMDITSCPQHFLRGFFCTWLRMSITSKPSRFPDYRDHLPSFHHWAEEVVRSVGGRKCSWWLWGGWACRLKSSCHWWSKYFAITYCRPPLVCFSFFLLKKTTHAPISQARIFQGGRQ